MTQEVPRERASPETAEPAPGELADSAQGDFAPAEPVPGAPHPPASLQTLRQAMRRARYDDAERMGAVSDVRAARIGRLELLEDALAPLQTQIPEDVDLFDFGLVPGANPRLFLDMIGFVEMGRDARTYRLVQDTRHGRKLLAESDNVPRMVDAVTDYVARRLLERDKALAADGDDLDAPSYTSSHAPPRASRLRTPAAARSDERAPPQLRPRRRGLRIAGATFAFIIDLLGVIALCSIVLAILYFVALQIIPAPPGQG